MLEEGKIGNREAKTLVLIFIITQLFLTIMAQLAEKGQTGTWIIFLVATIVAGVLFLPLAALMERYPGESIIEVGRELTGPYFNSLFSFFYIINFLFLAALTLRQYAERVLTVSTPDLPVSIAMGVMLGGALLGCHLGLEAMARSSLFIIYFIGFTVLLVSLLTYPYWRFDYLFPLAGPGVLKLIKEGFFRSSLMSGVLLLAIIFPSLKETKIQRIGLDAIATGGLMFTLATVASLMTFEASVLQEMSLPSYEMSRLIYFGRFLQRLESIFMPTWALVGMMQVAIGIYCGSVIITRTLQVPYHRPFLLPVSIITYALAFLAENVSQTLWVDFYLLKFYGWIPAFLFPALLFVLDRRKKKEERKKE